MIEKIDSIAIAINKWMGNVLASMAAVILVLWVFVMTASIICRALFDSSWLFIEEYTAYLNLIAASGGFAYATYKGQHIAVRMLVDRLSGRARLVQECATTVLSIWLVAFLALKMADWVSLNVKSHAASLQTATPLWVPYLVLAIGFFSFLLSLLIRLFHSVVGLTHGNKENGGNGVAVHKGE